MAVYTIQPTRKPHQTREPRGLLPSGGKTQANSHGVQVPCIDGALALPMQSEEAQPLLFVGGGLDGLEFVAGGGDGRAKERFVQRLLAENDSLALGMGGSDFLNGEGVAMASLTWDSHMPHAMPLILSVVWIMERSPFGAGRRRRSAGRNHEK